MGLATQAPMQVDDGAMIATSFPSFIALMNGLGAEIG
jgi:3-phosphoshikimate 1-carboxyvinyltransferase